MADTFSILTVCTGNICRSPAAERLLAATLGPEVRVSSAGLRAVVGDPVSAPMVPLVHRAGASCDGFSARQVTETMVRDADLVLALSREHRAELVAMVPAAVRRTFTLRELAYLAESVPPGAVPDGTLAERLTALIPLAAAQRWKRQLADDELDVPDPYGRSNAVYAKAFDQIESAVALLVQALTPSPGAPDWDPIGE